MATTMKIDATATDNELYIVGSQTTENKSNMAVSISMTGHLRIAILLLTAVLMPISYGMADSLAPPRSRILTIPTATAPLTLAQATDPGLCRRRCDFDNDTAVQLVREQARKLGSPPAIINMQMDGLRDALRLCYRECGRP
jgi:hypothetical protein